MKKLLAILLVISIIGLTGCASLLDFTLKSIGLHKVNETNDSYSDDETDDEDESSETTEETTKETTEAIKYKFELKADKTEFLVNDTNSIVTFTVSISEEIKSITLTEKKSKTDYTMVDDGAFSEGYGGDDIANDGTYTASIALDTSQKADLKFTAVVETSKAKEKTNSVSVSVLSPLDSSISDEMSSVYEDETLLASAETIKNSTDQGEIDKAREDIVAYFKGLEKDGTINDLKGDKDSESLSFTFSSGVLGGFILEYDPNSLSLGGASPDSHLDAASDTAGLTLYEVDEDNIVGNNKALILTTFDASATSFVDYYVEAYNKLDTAAMYDFAPNIIYNATVANYQTELGNYGMIFIDSHGTIYNGDPIICLNEKVTADNIFQYSLDLLSGRLVTLGSIAEGTATYAITPSFITYYYGGGGLDNSLVNISICKGYKNSKLVDAFINAGAGTVTGYTDTVLVSYDKSIIGSYLDNLMAGKTAKEAQDAAIAVCGADDGDATPAAFKLTGNEDLTIMQMGIINGSFEEDMTGWSGVGDSRVISWLSDVNPTDQGSMAIISTGLGSAEASYGTEGSSLQQTFIVPADAKLLVFDYDVVSEEPMEYVASSYDDYFDASITDMAGGSEQLVYENVNNSAWVELGGDYFSGGDDTTYETTWTTKSVDISAYAGKCITLVFHTGDVGDSAYDTAGLLDKIQLYVSE